MLPTPSIVSINTWFRDEEEEEQMFDDHAYLWRHLINLIPEKDLWRKEVLDYGCNRGGFLRTLFGIRPFRQGVGVDIAQESMAMARRRSMNMPLSFMAPGEVERGGPRFDLAFSHEVLYLLPDLAAHARLIANVLNKNGVYYAVSGCHTGNPLWPRWRTLIEQTTNLPVYDYSLDDYAKAFRDAGLRVEMRPFGYDEFVYIKPTNTYFPTSNDSLDYHTRVKTIIRAVKGE